MTSRYSNLENPTPASSTRPIHSLRIATAHKERSASSSLAMLDKNTKGGYTNVDQFLEKRKNLWLAEIAHGNTSYDNDDDEYLPSGDEDQNKQDQEDFAELKAQAQKEGPIKDLEGAVHVEQPAALHDSDIEIIDDPTKTTPMSKKNKRGVPDATPLDVDTTLIKSRPEPELEEEPVRTRGGADGPRRPQRQQLCRQRAITRIPVKAVAGNHPLLNGLETSLYLRAYSVSQECLMVESLHNISNQLREIKDVLHNMST